MYYKIVTPKSFFTDMCADGTDVFDIPYGTVFNAPEFPKHNPVDSKCMIDKSCFHFADGAFDTMLWYTKWARHTLGAVIYKIEPIGNVKKERCLDSEGLYQCGARAIKILKKQNINKMYDNAIAEYYKNRDRYKNFDIDIHWWKEHKTTIFLLKDPYDVLMFRARQRQKMFELMHEDIQIR